MHQPCEPFYPYMTFVTGAKPAPWVIITVMDGLTYYLSAVDTSHKAVRWVSDSHQAQTFSTQTEAGVFASKFLGNRQTSSIKK